MSLSSFLGRVALGVVVAQAAAAPPLAPPPTLPLPPQQPPGAVVVTYADGRRTSLQIGQTACASWTPLFPRVEPWTPPPSQLPVSAVGYKCERTPEGVRVAVSVFRGSPHQQEDPIATVVVKPAEAVVIDQLRAVGVQPVTLSLGSVTPAAVPPPRVEVVSPLLEVVEIAITSTPPYRYQLVLRNRADKAVRSIAVMAARVDRPVISARPRGREGAALIEVAADYVLSVAVPVSQPAAGGSMTPNPVDRIQISAVVWADGSFAGGITAISILVADRGYHLGLGRVLMELQRARSAGTSAKPADLRAALRAVSIDITDAMIDEARARIAAAVGFSRERIASELRVCLQVIKDEALKDLAAFEASPAGAGAFDAWLNTTTERYFRWFERLK